jgi:glycosyltransferase involved in cell wall biosynthesis
LLAIYARHRFDGLRAAIRCFMRILTTLTYYTPHISGLTVYATRVIKGLAERGHKVTVLTSHYARDLARREEIDGATVIRSSVWLRLSKGVLMPSFFWRAARLLHQHDLLYLHLPQFEAAPAAAYARLVARKPVVTSYQCDIELPPGLARSLFSSTIHLSHRLTAALSTRIVATSQDYADHSPFLSRYGDKVLAVYPPCPTPHRQGQPLDLRVRHGLGDSPIVGFLGRFAEEKGVQYLIDSVPEVLRSFPDTRFVLAGQREKVFGEKVYERLLPRIAPLGDRLIFPGQVASEHLADFFSECDVLVLPSINSTESFGMVPVEAMLCGTPVVATDLPGVREPVRATGMGEIARPRDAADLASAIIKVLNGRARYVKPHGQIADTFDPSKTVDFYEDLFLSLTGQPPARAA